MKQKTLTEKFGENPYILATLVLGLLVLGLIFFNVMKANHEINKETSPKTLCSKIRGTPSWFNWRGDLLSEGYKPFNESAKVVVDDLIKNKIYFVYSSYCGWCHKQIDFFDGEWQRYKDSGFTIDCAKVK